MTYERCIVEFIVKDEQRRAKYVGNSKRPLTRDAVCFTQGINTTRIMIEFTKRLMNSSIDYHTRVIHEGGWSQLIQMTI